MHRFIVAAAVVVFSVVHADADTKLPSQPHITTDLWSNLFDTVGSNPGNHTIMRPDLANVRVIEVPAEKAAYYFLTKGPAAPALAVVYLVRSDGRVFLEKHGYFAGNEDAFALWFKELKPSASDLPDVVAAMSMTTSPAGPAPPAKASKGRKASK